MLIHSNIEKQVNILKQEDPKNVVLFGPEGLGKRECAFSLASSWLNTDPEQLFYHSDFRLIEAEQGCIRAEQATLLQKKASYIVERKAVCVVLDAEKMTSDLQNKLLKTLEDGAETLAVIFVTTGVLLDTICSRCMVIRFNKWSLDHMYKTIPQPIFPVLLAADGCPGVYDRIMEDNVLCEYLESFYRSVCEIRMRKQLKDLLCFTHALKEKDLQYLPDAFESWQMKAFLNLVSGIYYYVQLLICKVSTPSWVYLGKMPELYTIKEAECIYRRTIEAKKQQDEKGYTKNDFFSLLMEMIPVS